MKSLANAILKSDYLVSAETNFLANEDVAPSGCFLEGESKAIIEKDFLEETIEEDELKQNQIILARAKIKKIYWGSYAPTEIYEWLDAHSGDFELIGSLLLKLLDEDDELHNTDIYFSTNKITILEWFEVSKKYRQQGLGKLLAKKILDSAAARGECLIIQPKLHDNEGNDPERLKDFWLNLDVGGELVYNEEFNTIYSPVYGGL